MSGSLSLPTGRRGQALALGVAAILAAVVWLGAAAPLVRLWQSRQDDIAQMTALAAHMEAAAASVPALQRAATAVPAGAGSAFLTGPSEAVAGASLQQAAQDMAARAGLRLSSIEPLPAQPAGPFRRLALHIAVTGAWPQIVAFLAALDEASPRAVVTELALSRALALGPNADAKLLDASVSIAALYRGAPS